MKESSKKEESKVKIRLPRVPFTANDKSPRVTMPNGCLYKEDEGGNILFWSKTYTEWVPSRSEEYTEAEIRACLKVPDDPGR